MFLPDMPNLPKVYLWLIKKSKTVFSGFIEVVNEFHHKPNKLWVDHGREFYNKLMEKKVTWCIKSLTVLTL